MECSYLLTGRKLDWSKKDIENLKPKLANNYDQYIIFKQLYKALIEAKNRITENNTGTDNDNFEIVVSRNLFKPQTEIDDWADWNIVKKITNPYELIYITSRYTNNSIAYYIPVSRSYFKMKEIITEFELFKNLEDKNITIACLGEGPGGFIESIIKNRRENLDRVFGITLRGNNKNVPNWKRLQYAIDKISSRMILKPSVDLTYGDLYCSDEIRQFINKVGANATIITADGGFDYTSSFNYQEQVSYRLIFSEIMTALHLQSTGGNLVCKVFDLFSIFSIKLLYLVHCFYDEVYLYKPKTSRPANSEKYLIAKGFKGITPTWLCKLREIHENWIQGDASVVDIEGITVPNDFVISIFNYNKEFVHEQINNINSTLSYINNPPNKNLYNKIMHRQIKNALEWCDKYKEGINYKSKYSCYF